MSSSILLTHLTFVFQFLICKVVQYCISSIDGYWYKTFLTFWLSFDFNFHFEFIENCLHQSLNYLLLMLSVIIFILLQFKSWKISQKIGKEIFLKDCQAVKYVQLQTFSYKKKQTKSLKFLFLFTLQKMHCSRCLQVSSKKDFDCVFNVEFSKKVPWEFVNH